MSDLLRTIARKKPPPDPMGWYVVAFSSELSAKEVLVRKFFGGEVVVYRTESGRAVVTEPFCPHLGAHLGRGGRVEGETLRCPFHGFRFDAEGSCVEAYPNKKIPPACRLPVHGVREKNGHVLVWFHPNGDAPSWEIPELPSAAFRQQRFRCFDLAGHPQETSENSVDIGHFGAVHGYDDVAALSPMKAEGPLLHGRYTMHRRRSGLSKAVTTEFTVSVWGLGYSIVEAHVLEPDLLARTFVLATPSSPGHVDLRISLSLHSIARRRSIHPLLSLAPRALLEPILERFAMRAYAADVGQDFDLWNHKSFLERPALADGDGPVGLYRKWAKQFYPARETGV